MLEWSKCPVVERVTDKVGGACVDEFLEWFPGVTREQVDAVLKHAERSLAEV